MKPKSTGGTVRRYVLRHTLRSPGKSLLCILLAVVFMLGLMLIRVSAIRSENELEELYLTTMVTAEIIKAPGTPALVTPSVVDQLTATGFLAHCYVEGSQVGTTLIRLNANGEAVSDGQFRTGGATLYGTEYLREFMDRKNIQGEITWFEDWNEASFCQQWDDWQGQSPSGRSVYPAVVSQTLYELFQMESGDMLRAGVTISDGKGGTKTVNTNLTVIGTHPDGMGFVFLPVRALQRVNGVDLRYDRVILTIDPAKNRQLDEFRDTVSSVISRSGIPSISIVYWDQELRQAITPMEQVISFMKTLYPVTLALSFIVAAGIAVLLSLLSAKEAAILRVLGNSKMTCRVTLCLQTILPCMVGLVIGHLGAAAMAYLMLPAEQAAGLMLPALGRVGLYLLYTLLGAIGASAVMTSKNPLELLQVKE